LVLVVSGSGNVPTNTSYAAAVWDTQAGTITTQPLGWDMFCNGMTILPDGRPFVVGGTLQYDPFYGQLKTSAFDPAPGLSRTWKAWRMGAGIRQSQHWAMER